MMMLGDEKIKQIEAFVGTLLKVHAKIINMSVETDARGRYQSNLNISLTDDVTSVPKAVRERFKKVLEKGAKKVTKRGKKPAKQLTTHQDDMFDTMKYISAGIKKVTGSNPWGSIPDDYLDDEPKKKKKSKKKKKVKRKPKPNPHNIMEELKKL